MLCDLQVLSGSVFQLEEPHAQSPFQFPIVLGFRHDVGVNDVMICVDKI